MRGSQFWEDVAKENESLRAKLVETEADLQRVRLERAAARRDASQLRGALRIARAQADNVVEVQAPALVVVKSAS